MKKKGGIMFFELNHDLFIHYMGKMYKSYFILFKIELSEVV